MPRFCRVLWGPRVTVNPQVINGPMSPGQQVWIVVQGADGADEVHGAAALFELGPLPDLLSGE